MEKTENRKTARKVAFAATIGNMVSITPAISATFGVFLVPISEEFDWPRSTVSGVLTLIAVISAFIYPVIGRISDRVGPRRILVLGNLLLAPAIACVALANGSVLQFYFLFGLIGIAGALPSTVIFSKIVSDWFDSNRGFVLGLTAGVGNGIGATIMPIIAGITLATYGWRSGFLAVGLLVFIIGFPILVTMLRDAPKASRKDGGVGNADVAGMDLAQAMRTRAFWIMLTAVAACAGAMTALFTHIVPVLTDRGIGLGTATAVISVFALVTALWQVATGAALDRFPTPRVIVPMYALAVLGIFMLNNSSSTISLIAAGAFLGIGMGAEYGAMPYFISRYFGLRNYGTIAGVMYAVVIFAQGLAPFLMDVGFDLTQSYESALLVIGLVLLGGMALVAALPAFALVSAGTATAEPQPTAAAMLGK